MSRSISFALTTAVLLLPSCDLHFGPKGDDDSASVSEEDVRTVPVRLAPVKRQDIVQTVVASATVESVRAADVYVETPGRVASLSVEEGAKVGPGTVLARLKAQPQAAQLRSASEQAQQAQRDLDALQTIRKEGFVSEQEFQSARLRLEQAQAALIGAQKTLSDATLVSPIRGVVALRNLRYGELASPGTPAFRIVDLDHLRVVVQLPERELSRLALGQVARVRSDLQGGLEVQGKVERIAPVVDPLSGTVRVTVSLPKGQRDLRPGSFVEVAIVVATREQVRVVPKRCLTDRDGKQVLYVVRDDKAVEITPELGAEGEEIYEILSDEPKEDDRIVVVGQDALEPDTPVKVMESPSPTTPPTEQQPS